MKTAVLFLAILICSSGARAQLEIFQTFSKATALYKCHYFFEAASQTAEGSQQPKLLRISNSLLSQASGIATQTGGEALNAKISRQGKNDFVKFMEKAESLPTQQERNEEFQKFTQTCASIARVVVQ